MGSHSAFVKLRVDLDNAITYGTKKRSLAIVREGLAQAKARNIPAETEYFLAQRHIVRAECAGAIEHLDKAIALNPRDGAAYNDRALCMVEMGIIDKALPYFDKGIEVESDYATIRHNKGWLLNHIGRHTEAIACFRQALELEPDRAVTYDNLADAQLNLGDLRGALESYRTVLRLLAPGSCRGLRQEIGRQIRILEHKIHFRGSDPESH